MKAAKLEFRTSILWKWAANLLKIEKRKLFTCNSTQLAENFDNPLWLKKPFVSHIIDLYSICTESISQQRKIGEIRQLNKHSHNHIHKHSVRMNYNYITCLIMSDFYVRISSVAYSGSVFPHQGPRAEMAHSCCSHLRLSITPQYHQCPTTAFSQ